MMKALQELRSATAIACLALSWSVGACQGKQLVSASDAGAAPDASSPSDASSSPDGNPRPGFLAQLADAEARWAAMKPTCASYYYDRSNYPAGGLPPHSETVTVWMENDRATLRHFAAQGATSAIWTEGPNEIGSHQGGFPAATVEQMLAECREIAQMDPSLNDIVVVANDQGFPVRCSIRPHGCYDACTRGVQVDSFNCGVPPDPTDLTGSYDLSTPEGVSERLHLHRLLPGLYQAQAGSMAGLRCQVVLDAQNVSVGRCATITLARSPDGTPSGAARLGSAQATVRRSTAPADLIVVPSSGIRPRLPWRPISLTFGRGDAVDWDQLVASLTVHTDRSSAIVPRLTRSPTETLFSGWAGAFGFDASFVWADVVGAEVTFGVPPGLRDFAGLVAPPLSATATVADLGPALSEHSFGGSNIDVARWGPVTAAVGNPACDTGTGCLQFGSPLVSCSEPGIAGLLVAPGGAATVTVKLRRVGPRNTDFLRVWFRFYSDSGVIYDERLVDLPSPSIDLGAAAGDARWASEWVTADFILAEDVAASRLGFEAQVSVGAYCPTPPAGYVNPTLSDAILVDFVRIRGAAP